MSTNDPEFYQAPKFTPEQYQAPPRQRGCFFYGCIIASVLALLMAISHRDPRVRRLRGISGLVNEYTATAPNSFPRSKWRPSNGRRSKTESRHFARP